MASGILIVAELGQAGPIALCFEMLGLARRMVGQSGGEVSIAVLGQNIDNVASSLIAHGADKVYLVDHALLGEYQSDAWVPSLLNIAAEISPMAIFLPHTAVGADLGPRLAFRLETGVATGCTAVEANGEKVQMTRPCYGNLAREVVSFKTLPAIATIKPKTQEPLVKDEGRSGNIVAVNVGVEDGNIRTRIVDGYREQVQGVRLENAKIIVAGGRGLGGPEGFKVLDKLAKSLGGAVGASRVACDLGWCPASWQIGLTGKTVTPELYIAVGISGASHHLAGIGGAKHILAINNDPDAKIFKEARFGVVGDYQQLVPALISQIGALEN